MTTGETENSSIWERGIPPEAVAAQPATTPPIQKAKSRAPSKKAKAKKAKKAIMPDSDFAKALIETLHALRKNNPTKWVDLRNGTKEGEQLHKMLLGRPTYKWRIVGLGHYLESMHDGSETVVGYVLPHDPMAVYRSELRAYEQATQRRKSKTLKAPVKPESKKKSFRWVITSRRGTEEHDGHEFTLDEAKSVLMGKTHLFSV